MILQCNEINELLAKKFREQIEMYNTDYWLSDTERKVRL